MNKPLLCIFLFACTAAMAKKPLNLTRIGGSGGFPGASFAASPAQQSIASPIRIAFPNRSDDYMRKFYQARSRHLVMVGDTMVERASYNVTAVGVAVGPDSSSPDPQAKPATYEQFLAAVESGHEFKTFVPRTIACSTCNGSKIQPQSGAKREMRRMCTACAGAGTQTVNMAAVLTATP